MLTALLLLLLAVSGVTFFLLWRGDSPYLTLTVVTITGLLLAYLGIRSRYYPLVALLTTVLVTVEPLALAAISPEYRDALFFIPVGLLFSSVIFPGVFTTVLVVMGNVALLIVLVIQAETMFPRAAPPLILNLTISAYVLIVHSIRHQTRARREQRARELAESEMHYRLMAENATDMIVRHRADGMFLYISPAVKTLLGYEASELIGRYPTEIFHPDDLVMMQDALRATLKSTERSMSTYRVRRKDGTYIWLETSSKAVRVPGSDVAHEFTSVSRDVSARKEADERLKQLTMKLEEQKNILDTVLTATPDQLAIFDRAGHYLYANPMALDGKKLHEVVGKTYQDLGYPAEICERFERERDEVFSTGEAISDLWLQYPTNTQGRRDLEYTYSPVYDSHNQIIALVSTSRDVTMRRQAEQERLELAVERERVKTLQHLISDTSHDLKTPLTTLNNSLYLLKKFISDPERREHYAQVLQKQVSHLVKILEDMDSMAKLDRATEEFAFQAIDLKDLLTQIVAEYEALALDKNQQFSFVPGVGVPPVLGDLTKIRRAITNLAVNALNYTPHNGTVVIRLYVREPEWIVIEVKDTGVGIRQEELSLIFERFYRSQNTAASEGSGLGLAITKKIVEGHGGSIEVESVPNVGSTFRIILPTATSAV